MGEKIATLTEERISEEFDNLTQAIRAEGFTLQESGRDEYEVYAPES